MLPKRKPFQIFLGFFLVVLSLLGMTWINYRFSLQNPGGNDFMTYWNPARSWLLKGLSPYDDQVGLATQQIIYGRPADITKGEDLNLFVYPIFSMIFFGPFGALDYLWARTLWMTILEMSAIALALISLKLSGWKLSPLGLAALLLFSLFWYPGVRTLILGQYSGINALLIVAAIFFIQQKRDALAGVLLALSMSKPQMSFLIIPFALLWGFSNKRWRLVQGILGCAILLWILPMLFLPDWPLQWLRELAKYPAYTARIGSIVEVISGAVPGLSQPLSLVLYAFFGLFLVREWVLAWGKDERWFLWTALMTLTIANIISIRNATTHFVELMPIPLLLFQFWKEKWGLKGEFAAWSTLGVLLFGLWAVFLLTVQGNYEQAAVYPAFPLACFLGLWWLRSRLIEGPAILLNKIPLTPL
jgi:Glycosyltransferase family 87